jgi:hypothetical protein
MPTPAQRDLLPAADAVHATTLAHAHNSLQYGVYGELETTGDTIQRIIEAVPLAIAAALPDHAFIFVPLALGETSHARDTEIARLHTADLADRAICHRTLPIDGTTYTFISTRLMQDRFALAFELYINVGHQYVDTLASAKTPLPDRFTTLLWSQALADVRGETSQDSYDARKRALELAPEALQSSPSLAPMPTLDSPDTFPQNLPQTLRDAEEQRTRYFESAYADTLAIYLLSLAIDLDYADLREREYPLLAPAALADRLRLAHDLFPAPQGYDFSIRYRRRH